MQPNIVSVDNFLLLSAKISTNHISSSVSNYYTNSKKGRLDFGKNISTSERLHIYKKRMCFEALAHVFAASQCKNCDSAQFSGQ